MACEFSFPYEIKLAKFYDSNVNLLITVKEVELRIDNFAIQQNLPGMWIRLFLDHLCHNQSLHRIELKTG